MAKPQIALEEGEVIVAQLEAELWATSQNPLARLIGQIVRIINLILGNRRDGFITITNKRVFETIHFQQCWVFNSSTTTRIILPSSVKEVGYSKEGTFLGCFCQAYSLFYEGHTTCTQVLLKDVYSDADAMDLVTKFYQAISYEQH
ncbi:MAG: hypothetical protein UHL07_03105 [Bacteroidaceae bacterium]|nr:hypothetical protein [Bacteroidaceae bacterium]